MEERYIYGHAQDWALWPELVEKSKEIHPEQEKVRFKRVGHSHLGLREKQGIKMLYAHQVDQDCLDEICHLEQLEYLNIEIMTATDVSALRHLPNLQCLRIYGLPEEASIPDILECVNIERLFLERPAGLVNLNIFSYAHHLKALGVEGSMYADLELESLRPLTGLLSLEALFLTSVRLKDKKLSYLGFLPELKFLECARFAPKENFQLLHELNPCIKCQWIDRYEIVI